MIWSEEDTQKLKDGYNTKTRADLMADFPGRTWAMIYKAAKRHGLPPRKRVCPLWNDPDLAVLKEMCERRAKKTELRAAFPGRTWYSIIQKARSIGFKGRFDSKWWSKEFVAIMEKHYETAEREDLLKMLVPRSWMSIIQKGQQMGLTRKAWMSIRKPMGNLHPVVKALRQRRIAVKTTQHELCKVAGYSVCTLQAMESGQTRDITFAAIEAFAGALGLKLQLVAAHSPPVSAIPDWLRRLIKERMPKTNLISFEDFDRADVERVKRIKNWAA